MNLKMRIQNLFSVFKGRQTQHRAANEQAGLGDQETINASPRVGTKRTYFSRVVRWLKVHLVCRKKQPRSDLVRNVINDTTATGAKSGSTPVVSGDRHSQDSENSPLGNSWAVVWGDRDNNIRPYPLQEWEQANRTEPEILASPERSANSAMDAEHPERVDALGQPGPNLREKPEEANPQRPDAPPASRLPTLGSEKQSHYIRDRRQPIEKFLVCHRVVDPDIGGPARDFFNVRLEREFLETAEEAATDILGTRNKQRHVTTQGTVANRVFYMVTNNDDHVIEYYEAAGRKLGRAVDCHNGFCASLDNSGLEQAVQDGVSLPWDQKKQEDLVTDKLKVLFKEQYTHFLCESQHKTNKARASNWFTTRSERSSSESTREP